MFKFVTLLLFFFSILTLNILADKKYCNIQSCIEKNTKHTMCLYPSKGHAASCGKIVESGFKEDEKNEIVELHNKYRQIVASGKELRGLNGRQPAALFMPNLTWNNELAEIAQRWANQCTFSHDKCRDTENYTVGQNLGKQWTTGDASYLSANKSVDSWYNEVQHFDGDSAKFFTSSSNVDRQVIGHYTQVVWAETNEIGCGQLLTANGTYHTLYVYCNYGPSGNYLYEPVYQIKP